MFMPRPSVSGDLHRHPAVSDAGEEDTPTYIGDLHRHPAVSATSTGSADDVTLSLTDLARLIDDVDSLIAAGLREFPGGDARYFNAGRNRPPSFRSKSSFIIRA